MISFCIQPEHKNSREAISVVSYCLQRCNNSTYQFLNEPLEGTIPVGSVEYCECLLRDYTGQVVNFYPQFLKYWYRRSIRIEEKFVKQASQWKGDRISDFVYISDKIDFSDEWRLYVADGKLMAYGWYNGENEDSPLPDEVKAFRWPKLFSGAVDVGMTSGDIALVEAHPPYACGWYGEGLDDYPAWLSIAWPSFLKSHSRWWFVPGFATDIDRW